MLRHSDWLTGIRTQRLGQILLAVPSIPPDLSARQVENALWRRCGGPLAEVRALIDTLTGLNLARSEADAIRRTRAGDQVAKALKARDETPLALALIRAGCFHNQARVLIECGHVDEHGNLRCPSRLARTGAPQLTGILQAWDGVQMHPEVVIPKPLVQELNTVWALMPPPPELPKWAAERKAVGDRAEMYTVQYKRTLVDPSLIVWVSRDSDGFGYDVEDRSDALTRCIEVKGRREADVVFYISDNEWQKAQELGARYEVHFWGGIDLSVEPAIEYSALRANGYPVVIQNFAAEVGVNWEAVPVKWRVTARKQT